MIPLRFKIASDAQEPFVIRIWSRRVEDGAIVAPIFEADLTSYEAGVAVYEGLTGSIKIFDVLPDEINGDVLFVNPKKGVADRLVRRQSQHNTFLITERCDQLCVMCSQPPKQHHVDMFPYFEAAALLAPSGAMIGISGGEPTLFKGQLFNFLRKVMSARQDLQFHILTNAQHFTSEDFIELKDLDMSRIMWGVPLYSEQASIHDDIVRKAHAHEFLLKNLALMARAGCRIELRTVLMQPNAGSIVNLAHFVVSMLPFIDVWAIMQMENIGYGRMNWNTLFFDSSNSFEELGAALDIVRSRGLEVKLYNFPLCTVPEAYRELAPATISDWKKTYIEECNGCAVKEHCGGFFEWHPKNHGYKALRML